MNESTDPDAVAQCATTFLEDYKTMRFSLPNIYEWLLEGAEDALFQRGFHHAAALVAARRPDATDSLLAAYADAAAAVGHDEEAAKIRTLRRY